MGAVAGIGKLALCVVSYDVSGTGKNTFSLLAGMPRNVGDSWAESQIRQSCTVRCGFEL